jgi:hypothetical protein
MVSFDFSGPVNKAIIDNTKHFSSGDFTSELSSGKHSIHYYSKRGMVHKKTFYTFANDTFFYPIKNLRTLFMPSFSLMNVANDFTTNVSADIGLQTAHHGLFGTIGFGGSINSNNSSYMLLGGGYQLSIAINQLFFISAAFNALGFIGLDDNSSGNQIEVQATGDGAFTFGPKIGFHVGTPIINGQIFAMPLFGMQPVGFRVGIGLGFSIGSGR